MIFNLAVPIEGADGRELTSLTLRERVVAGDVRGIKLSQLEEVNADDYLRIIGRLSAQPDHVINRLSIQDVAGLVEVVVGFLGKKPGSSSTSTTTSP